MCNLIFISTSEQFKSKNRELDFISILSITFFYSDFSSSFLPPSFPSFSFSLLSPMVVSLARSRKSDFSRSGRDSIVALTGISLTTKGPTVVELDTSVSFRETVVPDVSFPCWLGAVHGHPSHQRLFLLCYVPHLPGQPNGKLQNRLTVR